MQLSLLARLKEWEGNGTGKIGYKCDATFFLTNKVTECVDSSGIEAMVKVRPTEAEVTSGGPSLQQRWQAFFHRSPDKPMGILVPFAG